MQINLKKLQQSYTESPQNNPLRYCCLHQVGEEAFENTTNVFKCKDYFNDFVAHKHGADPFVVYGISSDVAKFDQYGGLTVLFSGITANLEGNMRRVLAPFRKQWGVDIQFRLLSAGEVNGGLPGMIGDKALVWFSSECFQSTFRISMLLLLIRNCNYNVDMADYDAVLHQHTATEGQWKPEWMDMIRGQKFDFPEQQKYWWHFSEEQNSLTKPLMTGSIIHNNGQANWLSKLRPSTCKDPWNFYATFPMLSIHQDASDADEDDEEELEFDNEEETQ